MEDNLKAASLQDVLGSINATIATQVTEAIEGITRFQVDESAQRLRLYGERVFAALGASQATSLAPGLVAAIEPLKAVASQIGLPPIHLPQLDTGKATQEIGRACELLGRGGWYPYEEMSYADIFDTAKEVEEGRFSNADNRMCSIHERDLDMLKDRILKHSPNRAQILAAAFAAHQRGEYELSVPVFLAQADGICYEAMQVPLFAKNRDKKPRTAEIVTRLAADAFQEAVLVPLAIDLPLSASQRERQTSDYPPGALNRHQVLHGECVDYGTRTNSYKSVSLLSYMCYACELLSDTSTA